MTTLPTDEQACAAEPLSAFDQELRRLRNEVDMLTKAGIIEVAVRNPSVAEYMAHWEGRALQAEAEISSLRAKLAEAMEVVRPFAEFFKSDHHDLSPASDATIVAAFQDQRTGTPLADVSIADFRAARRFIEGDGNG